MHKKINSFIEKNVARMPALLGSKMQYGVKVMDSIPMNHGRRIRKQLENILAKSPQLVTRQQHLFAAFVVIKAYEQQVIQPALKGMEERRLNQERIKELEEIGGDIFGDVDNETKDLIQSIAKDMPDNDGEGIKQKIEREVTQPYKLATIEDIKHHGRNGSNIAPNFDNMENRVIVMQTNEKGRDDFHDALMTKIEELSDEESGEETN